VADVNVSPEPSDEEAAAIVAAIEVGIPRGGAAAPPDQVPRWRWSGRWWSKPIPQRRIRP
jgi:hypothetical protein